MDGSGFLSRRRRPRIAVILTWSAWVLASVTPVTPDGDEAREWAERELSDRVYQAAEPTPLDRIARAIGDFLASLFSTELSGDWGPWVALVAAVIVVLVIVTVFLVWGVPRATGRSRGGAELFGEREERSAVELRRDAQAAAARGEWDAAIVLRFRALARGLLERGVVDTPPGATVHAFARAAGRAFPSYADRLESAAVAFDDVRYLRRPGSAELYRRIADVDETITAARPALSEPTAVAS
jgi:hypothetical protein